MFCLTFIANRKFKRCYKIEILNILQNKIYVVFIEHCQSLPRVVGPYTLSNLCQRLYAKNLGRIRFLKGNLI